jgi:hypothetical protein
LENHAPQRQFHQLAKLLKGMSKKLKRRCRAKDLESALQQPRFVGPLPPCHLSSPLKSLEHPMTRFMT